MAYEIGDPNHIQIHNSLVADVQAVADAWTVTVTLPDTATLGDLGHTSDHNMIVTALDAVTNAFMPYNDATGGTETVVTNYNGSGETWRVHTLANGQSLNVTKAVTTFRVLIVGGGGGSNNVSTSGKGAGGVGTVWDGTRTLTVGAKAATVGSGGSGGNDGQGTAPTAGGSSVFAGTTRTGGGINANGAYMGPYVPNTPTTITGASRNDFGGGGTHGSYNGSGWGNAGNAGAVIVAYRIG